MKINDVKELEGWYSFPVAAAMLKVKRQRINQLLDEDKLGEAEVRRVPGSGDRPAALLVSHAAVARLQGEKDAAEEARLARHGAVEVPAA